MNVRYAEQSFKDLKDFNQVERVLIAKKIEYLAENFETLKASKKIRELKGCEYKEQYRYTIARKIRAIFRIEDGNLTVLILRIGKRKDVY